MVEVSKGSESEEEREAKESGSFSVERCEVISAMTRGRRGDWMR